MNSKKCHLCNKSLFNEPIIELNGMPKAAQYYPKEEEFEKDKGILLNVYQCSQCGLVQLNIKPVEYYKEVITAASFSKKARLTRLKQMKGMVSRFKLKGKTCLEIGSGKGEMLTLIEESGLLATGLEASPESVKIGKKNGRNIINKFISEMDSNTYFDSFVSLNYLEHLPKPGAIIRKIYSLTTPDSVGYITVPNLEYLLKTGCFYEFVTDHLSYFTQNTLTYAFETNGFDVLSCETINKDNDIEVLVKKKKKLSLSKKYKGVETLIKQLQLLVNDYTSKNKKVAVWGAGHRTLALLSLAKLDSIEYIIDSAKFKQGRFTPVLHLNIVSPDYLREKKVDLVIIMVPGLYPDEVKKSLQGMNLEVDIAILSDNKIKFI